MVFLCPHPPAPNLNPRNLDEPPHQWYYFSRSMVRDPCYAEGDLASGRFRDSCGGVSELVDEHDLGSCGVIRAGSSPAFPTKGLLMAKGLPEDALIPRSVGRLVLRKWLSGRASPCQGEGREFESRLPLHTLEGRGKGNPCLVFPLSKLGCRVWALCIKEPSSLDNARQTTAGANVKERTRS